VGLLVHAARRAAGIADLKLRRRRPPKSFKREGNLNNISFAINYEVESNYSSVRLDATGG